MRRRAIVSDRHHRPSRRPSHSRRSVGRDCRRRYSTGSGAGVPQIVRLRIASFSIVEDLSSGGECRCLRCVIEEDWTVHQQVARVAILPCADSSIHHRPGCFCRSSTACPMRRGERKRRLPSGACRRPPRLVTEVRRIHSSGDRTLHESEPLINGVIAHTVPGRSSGESSPWEWALFTLSSQSHPGPTLSRCRRLHPAPPRPRSLPYRPVNLSPVPSLEEPGSVLENGAAREIVTAVTSSQGPAPSLFLVSFSNLGSREGELHPRNIPPPHASADHELRRRQAATPSRFNSGTRPVSLLWT